MTNNQKVLYSSKDLLKLVCETTAGLLDEDAKLFISDLPDVDVLSVNELEPSSLPVVKAISSLGPVAEETVELVEAIKSIYQSQAWRQPYTEKEIGTSFINGSAWFPIADIDGPVIYEQGLIEIMLLDSNICYPKHSHSPEELYIVLAGQVWWEADGASDSPKWKKAGETMHHLPNQVHSITAGEDPVLILNLWRGGGFEMPEIS